MIRKLLLLTAAVLTLTLGALASGFQVAEAQTATTAPAPTATPRVCTAVGYNGCIAYPAGGFGSQISPTPAAVATTAPAPAATAAPATGTGSGAQIAFTGSESAVLGYVGAGLIGFGVVALTVRRKLQDSAVSAR